MPNIPLLTRAEILRRTAKGKDVFRHYLGHAPKRGRNFQNPFVEKQLTPSFNLYPNEVGEWRYKDFATNDEGSCFDLVMRMHNLTLPQALAHVVAELSLGDAHSSREVQPKIGIKSSTKVPRPFHPTYREEFTDEELAYWRQYGISEDVLVKYQVRAVSEYTATRSDNSRYTIAATVHNPLFAYHAGPGFVKVYAPEATNKAFKFTWPTGNPDRYVFGRSQLRDHQPVILLAAGEKDAMALSAHGYAAVTVGSENVLIPAELIAALQRCCDEVIICYDADETGRTRSKELGQEHGLRWVEWPAALAPHGKDAADFFRAVHQKHLPAHLLMDAINQAPGPLPKEPLTSLNEGTSAAGALPTVAQEVYDALPDFLRRACAPFEGHPKAVMLFSLMGVLSGCFHGVSGLYDQRRLGLNLYCFICAPAASGKGTMMWAQRLARPYHQQFVSSSKAQRKAHRAAHVTAGKEKGAAPLPPHRMLYLPGDTTGAALLSALEGNEERGIICESEADTLTSAMGGEHGKFGDKLCKIFHHEPVPLMRKGDDVYLELERPAVSIVLTGTPAQLPRLMPNPENGLISRFLFYFFEAPYKWRSAAPNEQVPLEPYFDALGAELLRMITMTPGVDEDGTGGVEFTLSPTDWARLDAFGGAGLAKAEKAAGQAGASSAVRLGLITFRLVGILTVLRRFENGEVLNGKMEAAPQDVTTALRLAEIALDHALHALSTLPTAKPARGIDRHTRKADTVAKAIELKQQGKSVRDIADQLGTSKSTVHDWIRAEAT